MERLDAGLWDFADRMRPVFAWIVRLAVLLAGFLNAIPVLFSCAAPARTAAVLLLLLPIVLFTVSFSWHSPRSIIAAPYKPGNIEDARLQVRRRVRLI